MPTFVIERPQRATSAAALRRVPEDVIPRKERAATDAAAVRMRLEPYADAVWTIAEARRIGGLMATVLVRAAARGRLAPAGTDDGERAVYRVSDTLALMPPDWDPQLVWHRPGGQRRRATQARAELLIAQREAAAAKRAEAAAALERIARWAAGAGLKPGGRHADEARTAALAAWIEAQPSGTRMSTRQLAAAAGYKPTPPPRQVSAPARALVRRVAVARPDLIRRAAPTGNDRERIWQRV